LRKTRNTSGVLNVLFLARIEREKGIYEALDAFAILKQTVQHARLIVAGDGPEKVPALEYVREQEIRDVEFVGFVEGKRKIDVLSRAHVYLFPTHGEGMPTSVLEAMAFCLPIITRPVGGLRDFFEDGRMGFLTDSLDPCVFAALMEELATNTQHRETMGEYNQRYAEKRFIASKVGARVENIYASIVAGG
jgi:glycosyltransferase involved in cell wall biosynthesis